MHIEEKLVVEALTVVIMNFDNVGIKEYDSLVDALEQNKYQSKPKELELDKKHHDFLTRGHPLWSKDFIEAQKN